MMGAAIRLFSGAVERSEDTILRRRLVLRRLSLSV